MKVIEMDDTEIHAVMALVASVLHLGNMQYEQDSSKTEDEAVTIKGVEHLNLASKHLQVSADDLKVALTSRGVGTSNILSSFFILSSCSFLFVVLFFVYIHIISFPDVICEILVFFSFLSLSLSSSLFLRYTLCHICQL